MNGSTLAEPRTNVPCRCHQSRAAVSPFHSGHCCFYPPTQVCHPDEVATWEGATKPPEDDDEGQAY